MPLTTITAWEGMFEQMCIPVDDIKLTEGKSILIIGAAGGVGSIAIQLAKKLTGLKVIATASRDITKDWCLKLGADHVINHYNNFKDELKKIDINEVDYIFCLNDIGRHFTKAAEILKPFGRICTIIGAKKGEELDISLLRAKSGTFSFELMFTKSSNKMPEMITQHKLLNKTAELIEKNIIKTTMTENIGALNSENLRKAHAKIESGKTIGKIVLSGIEV